jgi:hypothetical protein
MKRKWEVQGGRLTVNYKVNIYISKIVSEAFRMTAGSAEFLLFL